MKWLLIVAGLLVLLVALVWLVGAFLPREHTATCRATFRASAEALFAAVSEVDRYSAWRPEVKSVRHVEPIGGKPAFVEESRHGTTRYAVEVSEPARKLVLRIADDSLPYGGTWTFVFEPGAAGTRATITEDGFVEPALFRALQRFAFGYHATLEKYLADLAQRMGETVTVERVE